MDDNDRATLDEIGGYETPFSTVVGASPARSVLESTYESPYESAPSSRCTSPVSTHVRSSSFQRFRRHLQRAWREGPVNERGSSSKGRNNNGSCDRHEDRAQWMRATRNIEMLANQKRQWYQIQSRAKDKKQCNEPTSLFEHFFIVGLHSNAKVDAIEESFANRKACESEILFKYPPGKLIEMRESDIPAFCFPEGIKTRLLERSPSMSDLNEIVFGQEHLARDDFSFVFRSKVSDNATLYGVCLYVEEIVQRAPSILGAVSTLTNSCDKLDRLLISAPRCYCILTRVPFFELHYEMLNSIIAQERLDRITQFVSEITLTEALPQQDQLDDNFDSPNWGDCGIPVDSVSGHTAPSAGLSSDREVQPYLYRQMEPRSPESVSASETSDFSHMRELDRESRKSWGYCDDHSSVTSGSRSDSFERTNGSFDNGFLTSPDIISNCRLERIESIDSVYSSVRDMGSEEDEDDSCSKNETAGDEKVIVWAKLHNNESLQIVSGYHALPLPPRGGEIIFHPLQHLQPIKYCRPGLNSLGLGSTSEIDLSFLMDVNEVNAHLAAAEEALALSIWTVATLCRVLSLDSVMTLITGALLEKQVIVVCPNMGVLSAIVLSLIPLIRPFEWQSLLLPFKRSSYMNYMIRIHPCRSINYKVLPRKMLDFLDAPVPFIVGIQHKPTDRKMKAPDLIRVNVHKDKVKARSLPQPPRHKELLSQLTPIHARLSSENSVARRNPIYKCSEVQAEAAEHFLSVMKQYLESLCSNLRSHTITNIQSNNDKVSLLLKDSFIDSFPSMDQPFIKLLVDTQLFAALSDSRMSNYENESY